jgi:hypothetical protein
VDGGVAGATAAGPVVELLAAAVEADAGCFFESLANNEASLFGFLVLGAGFTCALCFVAACGVIRPAWQPIPKQGPTPCHKEHPASQNVEASKIPATPIFLHIGCPFRMPLLERVVRAIA